ncbi:MAG: metallophosphoesterase [Pirellula sp.]|nr:metallophosphoesterase [Pirellula sp.]
MKPLNDDNRSSIHQHCERPSYFLSDLHLFSSRSTAPAHESEIYKCAQQAHTIILGGDIFDFKWSRYSTLKASVCEAISWLEKLVASHQDCSFYYLLGNHDSHPEFVLELDRLAFKHPNLEWQPHLLRLGACVFLHGDVIDGGLDHQEIDARRRKHEDKPLPMAYRHWLYDAAVQAKLHCLVANVARRHSWVLKKIYRYLVEQGLSVETGIRDVYFGHTHRPLRSVEYRGLRFHNGGASIRGVTFHIIKTLLPDPTV